MAGLDTTSGRRTSEQARCCEQNEQEACCAPEASSRPDVQAAGTSDVRERVRDRYAAAAVAMKTHQQWTAHA
jgi:hypothetical protein